MSYDNLAALTTLAGFVILALLTVIVILVQAGDWDNKRLKVGDKAPQALLDHKEGDGHLGGMIEICPTCNRINSIFHP